MKNLQTIFPMVMAVLILTVLVPTMTVQGELKADYSISVLKQADIGTDHWKVYVNEEISFFGGSSTGAKGYTWDFGEGEPQYKETSTIAHNYTKLDTYMVTLTVNDDDNNTDTKYGNITVVDRPKAILIVKDENGNSLAPDYKIEVGKTIILDASTSKGDIQNYVFGYDLPNAFNPQVQTTDSNCTHRYTSEGTYNVGLRVVDRLGNNSQMAKSEFITIKVTKTSSNGGSSFELPVPIEYLGGAIALIVVILVVAMLYRNGYIGGPVMTGRGGSSSSGDKKPEFTARKEADPSAFMSRPSGKGPVLPDLDPMLAKQNMRGFGKPLEEKTVYEVKTCPKCRGKIPITSLDRPLKVTCPDCSASFTLKGKPQSVPAPAPSSREAPAAQAPKKDFIYDVKSCPKCKSKIPITSEDRPLKVTCPGCSASFTLKGKSSARSHASTAAAPAPTAAAPASADDTEIVICPACGKAQPVSASASSAACVSCNSRFEL